MSADVARTWTDERERFVVESNRIEGIHREPTAVEREAHAHLWALYNVEVSDLRAYVLAVAGSGSVLRDKAYLDIRVGNYFPPAGGPHIEEELRTVLDCAHTGKRPWDVHVAYERLHPFLDGNGRSGRALWAWQMLRQGQDPFTLGFLHTAYYQALSASRA